MLTCRMPSRCNGQRAGGLLAAFLAVSLFSVPAMSANDAYQPPASEYGYDDGPGYRTGDDYQRGPDVYDAAPQGAPSADGYRPDESYRPGGADSFGGSRAAVPEPGGYGEPYAPAPAYGADNGFPEPKGPQEAGVYEQNEIVAAGHSFFGSISQGLAKGIEYVFQNQGRPNGYILGEDAGGALVFGLRYGEGVLQTKNAGTHRVFWQGPTVGYDAGAEGSKAMILVYNMRDPSQIFERFGGVQGAAYLVGGVSVQLQKHGDVTLAVIRSGVGLRLGANVGYMKYTRSPTWNPL